MKHKYFQSEPLQANKKYLAEKKPPTKIGREQNILFKSRWRKEINFGSVVTFYLPEELGLVKEPV